MGCRRSCSTSSSTRTCGGASPPTSATVTASTASATATPTGSERSSTRSVCPSGGRSRRCSSPTTPNVAASRGTRAARWAATSLPSRRRSAPAAAERDPLLGPWLRYARDELGTTSAVLWREAVDLTGEFGEVTSLLGAGGLLGVGGRQSPIRVPADLSARARRAGSSARRSVPCMYPALDMHAHGMDLACHVVDFGPGGLIGFQRDWIYRETGAAVPVDRPDGDPSDCCECCVNPPACRTARPGWETRPPSDWPTCAGASPAALDVFGDAPRRPARPRHHRGRLPRRRGAARGGRPPAPPQPLRLLPASQRRPPPASAKRSWPLRGVRPEQARMHRSAVERPRMGLIRD